MEGELGGYVTTPVAAEELGVTDDTVRQHIYHGSLRSVQVGGRHFIAREELERFKAERRPVGRPGRS